MIDYEEELKKIVELFQERRKWFLENRCYHCGSELAKGKWGMVYCPSCPYDNSDPHAWNDYFHDVLTYLYKLQQRMEDENVSD